MSEISRKIPKIPKISGVIRRTRASWLVWALLGTGLWGMGSAQETQNLTLFGQSALSANVNGADYVREDRLNSYFRIARFDSPRWGHMIQLERDGIQMVMPLEGNTSYASEVNYGVQVGTRRFMGRTATELGGSLFLPLSTLAEGYGIKYLPGSSGEFSQSPIKLSGVASAVQTEAKVDRVVFELSRPANVSSRLKGNTLILDFPYVTGDSADYTIAGLYIKQAKVERASDATGQQVGVKASLELPKGLGYRVFTLRRDGGVASRVVLDIGPKLPRGESNLTMRQYKPIIVIDAAHGGSDVGSTGFVQEKNLTLEVARQVGKLLSDAGWQVKFTRVGDTNPSINNRAALARTSDLFLSFRLANFPGAAKSGITLYRPSGVSGLSLTDGLRFEDTTDARFAHVVSPLAESQKLSSGMSSALNNSGFKVWEEKATKDILLQNSPRAGLIVELGWLKNPADIKVLRDKAKLTRISEAVARSVATYLTPKDGS
jgi:N-acetylmuramoyl-L-alanine amidase